VGKSRKNKIKAGKGKVQRIVIDDLFDEED
jgi:hypothetical protein